MMGKHGVIVIYNKGHSHSPWPQKNVHNFSLEWLTIKISNSNNNRQSSNTTVIVIYNLNVGLKYIVGPVERLFSIGGKCFLPERCKHTDSVFEKLMKNNHLV